MFLVGNQSNQDGWHKGLGDVVYRLMGGGIFMPKRGEGLWHVGVSCMCGRFIFHSFVVSWFFSPLFFFFLEGGGFCWFGGIGIGEAIDCLGYLHNYIRPKYESINKILSLVWKLFYIVIMYRESHWGYLV